MKLQTGDQLAPAVQRECLARFVHRFTREHVPAWAREPMPNGKLCPVQFASDAEWLARTRFWTRDNGGLSDRHAYCISDPTWPDGVNDRGQSV